MAGGWLQVKVELLGGMGTECDPPPGRIFAIRPSVAFERLAEAINSAFGRWDHAPLHIFGLADGRRVGSADAESPGEIDHASLTVTSALDNG